jgi:hypothetical protein
MDQAGTGVQEAERACQEQQHGSTGLRWLVGGAALLVVYILSVGPAAKMDAKLHRSGKHPRTERVMEVVYSPLAFLAERCPPAGRFLAWYLRDVWRIDAVLKY